MSKQDKEKRPRGRPAGSYQYDEPKVHRTHYMTQPAHDWILENKDKIEKNARNPEKDSP